VASASSSVGASPTGSGVPETPLSVKSAGASPPQSSGKHLHINLGNQFRAGGSLPNVNNNVNCDNDAKEHSSPHPGAIHSIDLKVCTVSPETKTSFSCCCPSLLSSRIFRCTFWDAPSSRSTEKNSCNSLRRLRSGIFVYSKRSRRLRESFLVDAMALQYSK